MTTQEQAEKLAMEAARKLYFEPPYPDHATYVDHFGKLILSTIPIKEMLDCRDALSDALGHLDGLHTHWLAGRRAINALDAKLKGKV